MPDGPEVGIAYVTLAASGKGIVSSIQQEMAGVAPAATGIGNAAGLGLGKALVAGVGVVAGSAALAGAAKAVYGLGRTFDEMKDTIRVGTGATGAALDDLYASAKTIGKGVPVEFDQVGVAVADLNTRLGLTGEPLEQMSRQFLNLTRITGTDLPTNIADITRVFGSWNIASDQQSAALDKIFIASQSTGIGINELAQSVVQFGAPLREMGFGFEESLALFGKFEKEGVNVSSVMAAMRKGLATFARAGEAPAEALKRAIEAIKGAGSAAEANQIALEVFGARAGPEMAVAIKEGRFELDELVDTITGSSETINKAAADTDDFAEHWRRFKNIAMTVVEPVASLLFDKLGGAMSFVADRAADVIGPVSGFFAGLLGKVKAAGLGLDDFRGVLGMLNPVMGLFKEFWPRLLPLLEQVGGLIIELARNVLPVLTAAWDMFIEMVTPIIEALLQVVMDVFPTILEVVRSVMEAVLPIITTVLELIRGFWQAHGATIMSVVRTVFGVVQAVVTTVMNVIKGVINVVMGILTGDWRRAWDGIKQIFSGVWDGMKAIWNLAAGWLGGIPGRIKGFFTGAGRWLYDIGKAIITGLWDGLKSAFEAVGGWFKSIGGWFKSWKGPITKDRILLLPEGKAIIEGLAEGMKSAVPQVRRLLAGLGAELSIRPSVVGTRSTVGGAGGLPPPITVSPTFAGGVVPGSGREIALLERIARLLEVGRGNIIIHAEGADAGERAGDAFVRAMMMKGVFV